MGLKGKLIASLEVKCGGHLVHDIPLVNHFEIHEGEILKVDGKEKLLKEVIEAIDHHEKSIT
ncbi:hypothetical protein H5410_020312 [Solanum commersonii]|uniref:Uncharacterized protein n=1 Tax=Solanum commersonii TaxID=4109 RepID=A0A9J5ZAT3_SOLCO|nr:hypothetical protein H5410_020312 [Solanum commersonii]